MSHFLAPTFRRMGVMLLAVLCAWTAATPERRSPAGEKRTLFAWGSAADGAADSDDTEEETVEPIATDRPDFTEASSAVGQNVFQIESGYTFRFDNESGARFDSHTLGELLFRYGVLVDWFELRAGVFPKVLRTRSPDGSTTDSGLEDLYLGIKFWLTEQQGVFPEMSLVPQMTVPTGARAFTNDQVLPGVNWLYGWDINDFVSLGASTQFNHRIDEETSRTYTEWAQSWTINYALTQKLGAYTEWFGLFPHSADSAQVQHYLDGGFTYKFTPDVQADLRAGFGLNSPADDFFGGVGLSVRFR